MDGVSAVDSRRRPLCVALSQVVAIADDQITLHRIAAALASAGLPSPGRTAGIEEAAEALSENEHGVSVAALCGDLSSPDCMAKLRRLHKLARHARLVVVSPATDACGVRRALDAGADGVVFEAELDHTLAASIIAVAAGQAAVPRRLRQGLQKPAFSHREREVLGHVAAGLTNSEIAEALFLSESTVKSHLSTAFAKLGVRSRKEAAAVVLDSQQWIGAGLIAAGVPTVPDVPGRADEAGRRAAQGLIGNGSSGDRVSTPFRE
jgi:DNA-binding NarL/FixJ family response regulator